MRSCRGELSFHNTVLKKGARLRRLEQMLRAASGSICCRRANGAQTSFLPSVRPTRALTRVLYQEPVSAEVWMYACVVLHPSLSSCLCLSGCLCLYLDVSVYVRLLLSLAVTVSFWLSGCLCLCFAVSASVWLSLSMSNCL